MGLPWSSDWAPFDKLREEMNDLFDRRLFGRGLFPGWFERGTHFPRVNMTETADVLTVECELPGVEREDVEVSMEGGVLRIRGERKAPETIPAEYHRRERDFGPFERTIELPVKVDVDNVKAKFSSGLLDIVLPKHPDSQPRRIEVKVG